MSEELFVPEEKEPEDGGEVEVGWEEEKTDLFQEHQPDPDDANTTFEGSFSTFAGQFSAIPQKDMDPHYEDQIGQMTYGRLLSRLLSRFNWYNPNAYRASASEDDDDNGGKEEEEEALETQVHKDDLEKKPSLDAAWAYFEHITLPRHFRKEQTSRGRTSRRLSLLGSRKNVCEKAEPGETQEKTDLYPVLWTPEKDLGDFGVGVGIYFFTLRMLSIITLIAGLISIPNIRTFGGYDYSKEQDEISRILLKGSAICTDQTWEACPNCVGDDFDERRQQQDRFLTDGNLKFVLKNNCEIGFTEGLVSLVALLFVGVSIYILGYVSRIREKELDENEQTASDYSIQIENPPKDARDPKEWKEFFESLHDDVHVTAVTVAIDNDVLINKLVQRRRKSRVLELQLAPGFRFDNSKLEDVLRSMRTTSQDETQTEKNISNKKMDEMIENSLPLPWWKRLMCTPDVQTSLQKINMLDEEIIELSQKEPQAFHVFVTFETEQAQHAILNSLTVSRFDVLRGNKSAAKLKEFLFRGEHLLLVSEPPEPSSVRWQDLDESQRMRILQRLLTFFLSAVCITGAAALITWAKRSGALASALVVSVCNSITPTVCKQLTNLESHPHEGSKQGSLYLKITAFRWFNTAIILQIVTPFTDTLNYGAEFLVASVYAIFFTETLKNPLMQLSDLTGNLKRHILGPRAPDQARMNLNFQGGYYQLAERYTEITKILFLTFFYSSLFPAGFFFAAAALAITYWTDKFCVLRTWAPAPKIGTEVAEFSRNYFFTGAVFVYALIASYTWASFPFDNTCIESTSVPDEYIGEFVIDGERVTITRDSKAYKYCDQDMLRYSDPPAFPAVPSFGDEWMTDGQRRISKIYGWMSIAVMIVVGVIYFNRVILKVLRNNFSGRYTPKSDASDIGFSDNKEIYAYVPQVKVPGFEFPLLACDVSGIDISLIGWSDPYTPPPYNMHNLIFDVPRLYKKRRSKSTRTDDEDDFDESPIFSVIRHWPPPEQ